MTTLIKNNSKLFKYSITGSKINIKTLLYKNIINTNIINGNRLNLNKKTNIINNNNFEISFNKAIYIDEVI